MAGREKGHRPPQARQSLGYFVLFPALTQTSSVSPPRDGLAMPAPTQQLEWAGPPSILPLSTCGRCCLQGGTVCRWLARWEHSLQCACPQPGLSLCCLACSPGGGNQGLGGSADLHRHLVTRRRLAFPLAASAPRQVTGPAVPVLEGWPLHVPSLRSAEMLTFGVFFGVFQNLCLKEPNSASRLSLEENSRRREDACHALGSVGPGHRLVLCCVSWHLRGAALHSRLRIPGFSRMKLIPGVQG